jgi:hypothetical protein
MGQNTIRASCSRGMATAALVPSPDPSATACGGRNQRHLETREVSLKLGFRTAEEFGGSVHLFKIVKPYAASIS